MRQFVYRQTKTGRNVVYFLFSSNENVAASRPSALVGINCYDRGWRALTSVNVPLSWPWSPPQAQEAFHYSVNNTIEIHWNIH